MGLDFKKIAKVVSAASKDPEHKIGAVIYDDDGTVISTGYNGAPRGIKDTKERYQKPLKQYYMVHAEVNAIANAARLGISVKNCTMLIYGKPPCALCAGPIIQAGIIKVVFKMEDISNSNYKESIETALEMLAEADIQIVHMENKDEC